MRILHLLEMNVKDIEKQIPKIAECGFTHVQIGNICPLKSDMYDNNLNREYGYKCGRNMYSDWYKLYQQLRFEIGNKEIGSKEELRSLCSTAKKYGIKIVMDFVPRHLANPECKGKDMIPNDKCDPEILAREDSFLYRIPMKDGATV